MERIALRDAEGEYAVSVLRAAESRRVVLFAVGGGGNPERHGALLGILRDGGFTVVAPHFERLPGPMVSEEELLRKARRLRGALETLGGGEREVVGVGHSIGATVLVALAGGELWMGMGRRVEVEREEGLKKLVLLAPAAGYFQAAGALDAVETPMLVWAGGRDGVTPVEQVRVIARGLRGRVEVEMRVEEEAGHFTFMDVPPPQQTEPHPDRDEFLRRMSGRVVTFAR